MPLAQLAALILAETARLSRSRATLYVALLILPIAALLTGMGVVAAYDEFSGRLPPSQLLLTQDGGFGERFEYIMTAAAALAMLFAWSKTHNRAYLALAALFGWLTADNSQSLHERIGLWLAPELEQAGIGSEHANHYGELAFMLLLGLLVVNVVVAALKTADQRHRARALVLVILVMCAAGFGVGVDMIDALVLEKGTATYATSRFVEDAGELWCFSLIAIFSIAILVLTMREASQQQAAARLALDQQNAQRATATPPL